MKRTVLPVLVAVAEPNASESTVSVLPQEQVSYRYAANAPIFAPLEKGAQAGTVTVLLDGRPIGTVPVCWGQTVLS